MFKTFLLVTCASIATIASASPASIGPLGIDSAVTTLKGTGVYIGEADIGRSALFGWDDNMLAANNTSPFGVYFQNDQGMAARNDHLGQHPTYVAGVMIGDPIVQPDYAGVAPLADLHSLAIEDIHDDILVNRALNRLALLSGGDVPAINLSFNSKMQPFIEHPDGNSQFTQFIDWSARRHDVLYVVSWANADSESDLIKPRDNYNGINVAASQKVNGTGAYRQFAISNSPNTNTEPQLRIDLLAPGFDIPVLGWGNSAHSESGGSIAAPHATGAVALLQQYVKQKIQENPPNQIFGSTALRHEVMKAVLLNSADKLAGVQGSTRDVVDSFGNNWAQSEAYTSPFIALDDQMGAGHLNVRRAVQQIAPGSLGGTVPLLGWNYTSVGGGGGTVEYLFNSEISGGTYVAATLVWDRISKHTGASDNSYNDDVFYTVGMEDSNDLNLYVMPAASNDFNDAISSSRVTNDSLEHIFFSVPTAGAYKIVVENSSSSGIGTTQNYAVAWWAGNGPPGTPPGDFNSDGKVDGEDFVVWRKDPASFDGAGGYDTWRGNFGAGTGPGSGTSLASVPEPSCSVLLVMVSIVVCAVRRSRPTNSLTRGSMSGYCSV